jgi:hypothetical protein
VDAGTIAAVFTGVAGVIAATGAVVKIVLTRPRLPVAEELLEQLDELRADVLALARWAHKARATAAAAGVELSEPPAVLVSSGQREGERQHDDDTHGWLSSVRAQTDPNMRRIRPAERVDMGPETQPDRRTPRHAPPPTRRQQ